jgi:DNA-binding MarR family transcriptional regulator
MSYHGSVSTEPQWLNSQEDRAWRAFIHAHHRVMVRLNQLQLQESGLTLADYELLAVLSGDADGRMPAGEVCALLQWEKSRLAHQVRHLKEQGLVSREPNPADGRSSLICLLPAGRRSIEEAAPQHVHNVRRLLIDLFSPAELDMMTALHERVMAHLAEDGSSERSARAEPLT